MLKRERVDRFTIAYIQAKHSSCFFLSFCELIAAHLNSHRFSEIHKRYCKYTNVTFLGMYSNDEANRFPSTPCILSENFYISTGLIVHLFVVLDF